MQVPLRENARGASQQFSTITIFVAAVVVVTAATIALLLSWSTRRVDATASARQAELLTHVLQDSVGAVARDQEASTVWDDAVQQLNHRPLDLLWIDNNLGVWFGTYYHHDEVYLVDSGDHPVYAMRAGRRVDPTAYELVAPTATSLLKALRQQLLLALPSHDSSVRTPGALDIGLIEGRPAIISVKPILPETGRIHQAVGTEYLHLSIRYLDRDFLSRLSQQYGFADVQFVAGTALPQGAVVPLRANSGTVLGYIRWRPFAPGHAVLKDLGPVLLGALVLLTGIVAMLILRIYRSTAQLRVSRARIHYLAFHDPLTGLANRALFEDRLAHELARVRRGLTQAALLLLDLDRFKQVNDTLGHPAGDELIKQVGARLTALLRQNDTVARIGGDEFAIIQTDATSPAAREILCQRIVEELSRPFELAGGQVNVGVSIGVALAPDDCSQAVELSRFADIALYQSKAHGRGQFTLFDPAMDPLICAEAALVPDSLGAATMQGSVGTS